MTKGRTPNSIIRLFDYSKISRSGFTLIELLVVVAMIALITGAVSTSMASAFRRARIQKATGEVKMLTQAILAYENHNKSHELKTLTRAQADRSNIGFLLGTGEKSASNFEIPVLIQAALSSSGVMRDPWGRPYLVTVRKGNVTSPAVDSLKTGYVLPNFYRLSEDERK